MNILLAKLKKEDGFTLVEMIFVVILLSTLITIASLSFSGIQEQTTRDLVLIDLKIIRMAAKSYYIDHKSFPASLNDLSGYLDELPEDKFLSQTGTKYQLSSSESTCTVWSVGPNRTDDHGDINKDIVLSFGP